MKRIHDAFENVHADDSLKAFAFQLIDKEYNKPKRYQKRFAIAAIAMAICLFFCVSTFFYLTSPKDIISIDSDASIELKMNRVGRVASITAYEPIDTGTVIGLDLRSALAQLIPAASAEGGQVHITVSGTSDSAANALIKTAESVALCASTAVIDEKSVQTAHENGMSCGKYRLSCELLDLDDSYTLTDCHDMSASNIGSKIETCKHDGDHNNEHDDDDAHDPTPSVSPTETPVFVTPNATSLPRFTDFTLTVEPTFDPTNAPEFPDRSTQSTDAPVQEHESSKEDHHGESHHHG